MRLLKLLFYLFIVLLAGVWSSGSDGESTDDKKEHIKKDYRIAYREKIKEDEKLAENLKNKDCLEFIELLSVEEIAKEYGKTEEWAMNHYVNLWKKTSENGKGRRVGIIRAGSRAIILEESGEDYRVQSPINNMIGWVNKIQVAKTIFLNPKTFIDCDRQKPN